MSYTTPINEAKAKVTVLELAEQLVSEQGKTLSGNGEELSTSCVLPDHDDKTPSFYVNPDRNAWYCHGCSRGGDVVRLAQLAWGYPIEESHTGAAMLLMEFGHEVPQRPPSWFARQHRQRPVRDAIDQARIEHVRMLVFRLVWVPWLKTLPPWVRDEAAESAWEGSRSIAQLLYYERRSA